MFLKYLHLTNPNAADTHFHLSTAWLDTKYQDNLTSAETFTVSSDLFLSGGYNMHRLCRIKQLSKKKMNRNDLIA